MRRFALFAPGLLVGVLAATSVASAQSAATAPADPWSRRYVRGAADFRKDGQAVGW
jgi:hypothetical protein